ncbi:MAG TPA: helix-turn-helix domain-containing protein [Longimicrobiaceae bacterium]|jgi:HTH-type transcriptional regulator/antitoxin HigA
MRTVIDIQTPHILRTPEECAAAGVEIDRLLDLDPQPYSADFDRLEMLSLLVEDYDSRNNPIDDSELSPRAVVDFMLDQKGMNRTDLAEIMGGRSRVSDFFSGKRELSKGQIAALRTLLGIPADLLL